MSVAIGFAPFHSGSPRESFKATSEFENFYSFDGFGMNGFGRVDSGRLSSGTVEYYDAPEDVADESSSDDEARASGRSPAPPRTLIRDLTSRLQEETAKRVAAEAALASEHHRMDELLHQLEQAKLEALARERAAEEEAAQDSVEPVPGVAASEPAETGVASAEAMVLPSPVLKRSQDDTQSPNFEMKGSNQGAKPDGENGHPSVSPPVAEQLQGKGASSADGGQEETAEATTVVDEPEKEDAASVALQELEAVLARKEKEISRLRDKLEYWERMNMEMSKQNTEAMEIARTRRKRWQQVQRVAVLVIGLAVGIAVTVAASSAFGGGEAVAGAGAIESSGEDAGDDGGDDS